MLTLRDLSLRFGSTVLLDRANLVVERGERIAVLGRNGAGKSTLLSLIEGEVHADGGEILRAPGTKIARLVQDVPVETQGAVFDVVAEGLGEIGRALARYQHLAAESPERIEELARLQARIEAGQGWALDARVREVITRLDLPSSAPFETLSGGLKRRVLLGQALVSQPDLLLLDEPTNHLDIESIAWLEDHLRGFSGGLVFVTHDRAFMRRLATRIVELDRGWLTSWPGDYENFLRRKRERQHAESQERALFDKRLAQEEAWIRQGIEARRTRNEGRVRRLLEMRQTFAARRLSPGKVKGQIAEAQASGKLVCEVKDLSYAIEGRPLVSRLGTTILRGDRLGLIGPNGVGKTTLIRLLLGSLAPDEGTVRLGTALSIAYFDQLRGGLDEDQPVFEALGEGKDFVEVKGKRQHVMGYLQDFLFTPDRARSPVRSLSGGERNRLLLARLFARPSNLLVLDEPTNDLDLETLELLEELLIDYPGTVLLVSHDREFLDQVVTRVAVFEGAGRISEYVGGYSDWLRQRPEPPTKTSEARPAREPPAARPGLSNKHKRELDQLPARINALEREQSELGAQLGTLYASDPSAAVQAQRRLNELTQIVDAAYGRWQELEGLRARP